MLLMEGEGEGEQPGGRVDYPALDCSLNRSCSNDVACIICMDELHKGMREMKLK